MVKLPVLQKLLNREKTEDVKTKKEKRVIVSTGYYSGMNFVLMVNEDDQYDANFINSLKNHFEILMGSDLFLEDVMVRLKQYNIFIDDYYLLEGIMFIVFKKEL